MLFCCVTVTKPISPSGHLVMAGYTLQVSIPPTWINNKQSPRLTSSFACSLNPSQIEQTANYFSHCCWILMNLQSRVWTRNAHTQTPSVTWHVPHTGCFCPCSCQSLELPLKTRISNRQLSRFNPLLFPQLAGADLWPLLCEQQPCTDTSLYNNLQKRWTK